ncbi:MAG: hypothetical protein EOO89_23330, partial [Pedobacter sp.]
MMAICPGNLNKSICLQSKFHSKKMTTYRRAYVAYQHKNYDQCLKFLQELKSNDVKRLDLEAQVYFRRKEYQKAYDIYRDLVERESEYRDERKENISTIIACAQLEQPGTLKVSRQSVPDVTDIVDQVQQINIYDSAICEVSLKPRTADKKTSKKDKKKRKQRLPKHYDPNVAPDPERWIPKRDR